MNGTPMVLSVIKENEYRYRTYSTKGKEKTMFKTDYEKTFKYMNRKLKDITKFCNSLLSTREFLDELGFAGCEEDYMDFDYWNAYNDNVDVNIYGSADGMELRCTIYPVVNLVPNYDDKYAIEIELDKAKC